MKSNKEMTEQEFAFTFACKRIINDSNYLEHEVDTAILAAPDEYTKAKLVGTKDFLACLRYDVRDALKVV